MSRIYPTTLTPYYGHNWHRLVVLSLFGTALFGLVAPVFAATPVGLWYAEGGAAQVEVGACGDALCGRIVWLRSPFDETGCDLRDRSNGDASLRDRPLLGLEILQGLKQSDAEGRVWIDGTIYDPTSGKTYACSLRVEGDDQLHLRGYVGIPLLGRTKPPGFGLAVRIASADNDSGRSRVQRQERRKVNETELLLSLERICGADPGDWIRPRHSPELHCGTQ